MTPRKSNIFDKALADAEKRLAKALNERAQAQDVLADLAKEIPSLQQTISALRVQTGALPQAFLAGVPEADFGGNRADAIIAQALAMTENDTLPEPEGEPVLPEE